MPSNGRLDLSTLTLVDGWAHLEPATARAWVAACDELVRLGYSRPTIAKPDGAYRDYAGQVRMKKYWTAQGKPLNAATPGTSNHGLGTCVDIYENWRWPRKVLVEVMRKHGFVFDYPPELWHAHRTSINAADTNTSLAGVGAPIPTPPKTRRHNTMATLYHKAASTPTLYALAGDSPGTAANWLETTDQGLANGWSAQIGGPSVGLSADTFDSYKAAYLAPVATAGSAAAGASTADVETAVRAVFADAATK